MQVHPRHFQWLTGLTAVHSQFFPNSVRSYLVVYTSAAVAEQNTMTL